MSLDELLRNIGAPAAAAGAVLLFAWGLFSGAARRKLDAPPAAAAIAVALGGLTGYVLVFGWSAAPLDSWRWIQWVFVAAAALGTAAARPNPSAAARLGAWTLLSAAAAALVFRKLLWPAGGAVAWDKAALFVALPVALTALWHALVPALGAALGAASLALMATGASALLLCAHSASLAQAGAGVASALGALAVACLLRPSASGMAGAILPAAVLLTTLALAAFQYASPRYSAALFALVALAPLCGQFQAGGRTWLRLLLVLAPVALAVLLALRSYDASLY